MHAPPEQVPTLGTNRSDRFHQNRSDRFHQNRSDRFSKPVRPISHSRPHPQKPKMQRKCTSSPLALGTGSRDAMQLFSTFLSPPCCQCMNQGSNLKRCNLELLKYTKFIKRCYTCPNEQVRYSTASYRSQLHDHQVSQPLDEAKMDFGNFAKNLPLMSKLLNMIKAYQNGKATQTSC
jgi:hypothetical protein